ncbi:DUF5680 domain-containing protein [Clostridium oryzae]|uniref:HTH cro/C1-type domain-containing protein n=1 Tax=Clostridium oryzae TaxID=1450648 RepID=A0A1V4IK37_9CLOT|nr:DUF5680 domain-containing protein [Clostridium oryzae]OPJ60392.1 hypothetical protein CLORY_28440 [Clostridium oryzae]
MSFCEKLQILRKDKGLSQENLAENIGVSRQAVAKWEAGQSYPDVDKLILLSDLFKVSIDRLVKNADDSCCFYDDSETINLINDDIVLFLIKAKRSTYAAKGAESSASRPNSHDYEYSEGNLKYIDTYIGGECFAGEEAVWIDDIPCWTMNYIGRVLSEEFSGDFLKEALLLVPKEHPYRGPMLYKNGEYTYHCIVTGEFSWYNGYEEIFYNDKKVYECRFHGGEVG